MIEWRFNGVEGESIIFLGPSVMSLSFGLATLLSAIEFYRVCSNKLRARVRLSIVFISTTRLTESGFTEPN